ncbi:MAG: nucleotide exchange factor GrpE [Deltaproteobacteria bacterium CG11_big_fil_rev_8_21_14_0_20_47_16]|nr:MAG: nucleotide exchange factor GrpE [Deltaproteobacteria bacterium CG11_big_fil_rev_8_21_14_0_20_47_16]
MVNRKIIMTEKAKTKVDELRDALKKRKEVEEANVDSEDATVEENSLEGELNAAREEAKEHYDKLLRVMADFDNFRRRNEKEKKEAIKFANEELIQELLTVMDHMDQALSHIKQSDSAEAKNLALGVELVVKQLASTLEKYGLKPVDAVGQVFDAKLHEALQMVDAEDVAPGTVVAQHRRGYLLGDRLLRPALVDVVREK